MQAKSMTLEQRRAFLEENQQWLGDLVVAQNGFFDVSESVGVSEADTMKILEERKRRSQTTIEA